MAIALPFSHEEFLDVFGAYNSAMWPVAAALWVATAGICLRWMRTGRAEGSVVLGLLAVDWAWSGIAYHWLFFRRINPAATLFAIVFVLQAMLFAWLAATSRGRSFVVRRGVRGVFGKGLVVYGLVYPVVGLWFGLQYPRMPVFGVPCPTTLVTAGLLLTAVGVPRVVSIVPVLWAIIGSSAAFALGIRADLALVVAALVLAVDALRPSALGSWPLPHHR